MIEAALYELGERDQQSTLIDLLFQDKTAVTGGPVTIVGTTFTIPGDRIGLIDRLGGLVTGAGGATIDRVQLEASLAGGISTQLGGVIINLTGSNRPWSLLSHRLILPPGTTLTVSATFSAGAAGHTIQAGIAGILIPRGNVSLGGVV